MPVFPQVILASMKATNASSVLALIKQATSDNMSAMDVFKGVLHIMLAWLSEPRKWLSPDHRFVIFEAQLM